jgi:hypothetical protein
VSLVRTVEPTDNEALLDRALATLGGEKHLRRLFRQELTALVAGGDAIQEEGRVRPSADLVRRVQGESDAGTLARERLREDCVAALEGRVHDEARRREAVDAPAKQKAQVVEDGDADAVREARSGRRRVGHVGGATPAPAPQLAETLPRRDCMFEPLADSVADEAEGVGDVALPRAVDTDQHGEGIERNHEPAAEAAEVPDPELRDHTERPRRLLVTATRPRTPLPTAPWRRATATGRAPPRRETRAPARVPRPSPRARARRAPRAPPAPARSPRPSRR